MSSNYPGTTVEFVKGYLSLGDEKIEVVDLPGTYSLDPTSSAEEVAVSLLKEYAKDEIAVVNILDSNNLERNLLLTLQLIEEGFPTIRGWLLIGATLVLGMWWSLAIDAVLKPAIVVVIYGWLAWLMLKPERWCALADAGQPDSASVKLQPAR